MSKIDLLTFRVSNPAQQTRFYCDVLGMHPLGENSVGYPGRQARLRFIQAKAPYEHDNADIYWKIALSVPDIELAFDQLRKAGIQCSEPHQFEDVGYLAHFVDPEGFKIELIDHAFKGCRDDLQSDEALLGGGAHLSLVTLRAPEIAEIEPTLLSWGMRKLSVQQLPAFGFSLHFYAFTDETPPDPNLVSVTNRTWVYQRPYTVLEIQHVAALTGTNPSTRSSGGFHELTIAGQDLWPPLPELQINWVKEHKG